MFDRLGAPSGCDELLRDVQAEVRIIRRSRHRAQEGVNHGIGHEGQYAARVRPERVPVTNVGPGATDPGASQAGPRA